MWCNAQILLDGQCFRFAKLKRFVGLDEKEHLHFQCANVRGLCGSIHRKLLFYSRSSRLKFVSFAFALSEERPLKESYMQFLVFLSLVCYVAVCACIRSAELQSSKSPTKGFILSKREGWSIPGLKRLIQTHPQVYITMWKYCVMPLKCAARKKERWFQ